ncbi:MAG: RNA-binding cell elongation regulator Jag/EloR [Desulfobacterales bacterium]|jgi:spoIIIJ-associated protein
MANEKEFVGRNLKNAIDSACKALDITPDEIQYDVLSNGSSGIFGLGRFRKARIRIVEDPMASDSPTKEDDFDKQKPPVHGAGEEVLAGDKIAIGERVLRRIVDTLSPESIIHVERNGTCVKYQLKGGSSGLLIGKRGQTLEAIQMLIEKSVNRSGGERVHIAVDVEEYLQNRRIGLIKTARRYAEKVKKDGKSVSMGYLNAQDRRTIHLALKNDSGILTQSSGNGYVRKLNIYPKP